MAALASGGGIERCHAGELGELCVCFESARCPRPRRELGGRKRPAPGQLQQRRSVTVDQLPRVRARATLRRAGAPSGGESGRGKHEPGAGLLATSQAALQVLEPDFASMRRRACSRGRDRGRAGASAGGCGSGCARRRGPRGGRRGAGSRAPGPRDELRADRGSRSAARATASASIGSDLPKLRAPLRRRP